MNPVAGHTDPAALELIEADAEALYVAEVAKLGAGREVTAWPDLPESHRGFWRSLAAHPAGFALAGAIFVVADPDAPRTVRLVTRDNAKARAFYWRLEDEGRNPLAVCNGRRIYWPRP